MIDTDTSKIVATATEKQIGFIRSLLVKHTGYREEFAIRVLNAIEAETLPRDKASEIIDFLLAKPLAEKQPGVKPSSDPWPAVTEGHYAVKSLTGNNDLDFFRVDRPTEGKYAGKTFVKRVIGGHPSTPVRYGEVRKVLDAILAAGETKAATLYGTEIGRCYVCNKTLTDELSRELGIGPHCRAAKHSH